MKDRNIPLSVCIAGMALCAAGVQGGRYEDLMGWAAKGPHMAVTAATWFGGDYDGHIFLLKPSAGGVGPAPEPAKKK